MELFKASRSDTLVSGQAVIAFIECSNRSDIWDILEQHGLIEIDPKQWYMQQKWLDVLRDITSDTNGMFNLVSIGMKIAETAPLPPHVNSIETALTSMNEHYHISHQNEDVGGMEVEITGKRYITITSWTPYPDDFEYGVIYGMARQFLPRDSNLVVRHSEHHDCRKHGGRSCTYHVTW